MDTPKKWTAPLLVLALVLTVVGLGAGVWLLANLDDANPDDSPASVPTEEQLLGTTTPPPPETTARSTVPATTRAGSGGSPATTVAPASTAPATTVARATTTRPAKDAAGFTIVTAAQLPKEARDTLALIAKGGPYPYDRDGIVFQNREGILPKKASGYYREYTVITPGERDRGARRIVAGSAGERYYTADHYESFVRVES